MDQLYVLKFDWLLSPGILTNYMWCKTDGEKVDKGPNGDVGIEGNSGSDGKGEWSEMVRECVEEG
mgnify:CR=1 FL=1